MIHSCALFIQNPINIRQTQHCLLKNASQLRVPARVNPFSGSTRLHKEEIQNYLNKITCVVVHFPVQSCTASRWLNTCRNT